MGGYFKVWRKIEDSKSWSRGALYRGLMITLLQKANWKQGYFHGQEILPGQLACSGASLASELDLSRYQVMRMLATLEDDGFISRKTFGKVCTLITVVNWQLYQSATEEAAQQPHNERTSSAQVPHTIEEGKKARKEIPPASADAAEELASLSGKEKQEGAGARTGSAHVTNKAPRSAASATGEGPAPEPAYRTATKRVLTGQRLAWFNRVWSAFGYKRGKAEGVVAGVPDVFLASPRQGFHGLYIEMKRQRGGTVQATQKELITALRQAGYRVEVCKGWWEAREVIENYLTGEIPKGASRRVEPAANQQPLADRRGRRAVQGR